MTLGGWKLVARGTSQVIRDLELSPPPLTSKEGTVAEDWDNHQRQWFNQSRLHNGTYIKTLNEGVWRKSRLGNTSTCWEGGAYQLQRRKRFFSCSQDPSRAHFVYLFIWPFIFTLYNILCNKLVHISKMFP